MRCCECGKEFSNEKQVAKGAAKGFGLFGTLGALAAAGGAIILTGGLAIAAAGPIIAGTAVTAGAGGAMMNGELSSKKCPHCGHINK